MIEEDSDGCLFGVLVVVGDQADETTSDIADAWGVLTSEYAGISSQWSFCDLLVRLAWIIWY